MQVTSPGAPVRKVCREVGNLGLRDERSEQVIRGSTLEALAALILSVSIATTAHAFGCTVSTTPINFGGYDTLSHNGASAVATITYTCLEKTQRVAIGVIKGYAATFEMRVMRTGNHKRAYNLYI